MLLCSIPACMGANTGSTVDASKAVPMGLVVEFSLEDVNPDSALFGELVSPRDYLGTVSVWYFGHAT